uniref:Mediator of RNA polymerase II transcription subunit 4 n=1 Tax=Guillardia theta TaxID=55529 RepID=A0A7S4PNH2_GUITH|mmetsp:Transcript_76/g.181  ORF Transcript_76/g.181 Transcript_76/m.181 type:complete len:389 (+) Transcript_76:181-1347(+)
MSSDDRPSDVPTATSLADAEQELGAPQRMAKDVGNLEQLTIKLIESVKNSLTPQGKRSSSGYEIHSLVREVISQHKSITDRVSDVEEHQARQKFVREKIEEVHEVEDRIDWLIQDLRAIEGDLSFLVHRAKKSIELCKGRPPVAVDDLIAYSNHCSFTTNAGIRDFDRFNKPIQPPDVRDPRFMLPYPPAHAMRLQGGLFSYASTRKPQVEEDGLKSDQEHKGPSEMQVDSATSVGEDKDNLKNQQASDSDGFEEDNNAAVENPVATFEESEPPLKKARLDPLAEGNVFDGAAERDLSVDGSLENVATNQNLFESGSSEDESGEEMEFEMDLNPTGLPGSTTKDEAADVSAGRASGEGSSAQTPPLKQSDVKTEEESSSDDFDDLDNY